MKRVCWIYVVVRWLCYVSLAAGLRWLPKAACRHLFIHFLQPLCCTTVACAPNVFLYRLCRQLCIPFSSATTTVLIVELRNTALTISFTRHNKQELTKIIWWLSTGSTHQSHLVPSNNHNGFLINRGITGNATVSCQSHLHTVKAITGKTKDKHAGLLWL